ncbi:MAG: transglutaminase family protein [Chitinophagaceae bacterium]|nr:transglutaminase family protein [Chitinophagaceae bacterium]
MKLEIFAALKYIVYSPSTLILNIHAFRSQKQIVLEEALVIEPYVKVEELVSQHHGNRFIRLELLEGQISISYKATVDNAYKETDHTNLKEVPVGQLDSSVFPYLYPSRYCQSDKLFRFARNKFGYIENPFLKVLAITNWIHSHVEYLSGSTNAHTSAYDTVTELSGVCRDFAHLGIALCRALTIPARYFTGYAYKLKPQDFHACFEAYLGDEWVLFDATKLIPLNALVKIATGRDAADSAVASLFGNLLCQDIQVSCNAAENNFEPYYYDASRLTGLAYQ